MTDANGNTTTGTLNVTIVDDVPVVSDITRSSQATEGITDTNLLLILDTSNSMNDDGKLATLKNATLELLEQYEALGDVRVRIVTFDGTYSGDPIQDGDARTVGNGWMTVTEAKAIILNLTAPGNTNYDAALKTAENAFDNSNAVTTDTNGTVTVTTGNPANARIDGAQNVSYFLSDGDPSLPTTSLGINASEETTWTNFLNDEHIRSYALGIGTNVTLSNLDPIAYDGTTATNTNAQQVTDISQLSATLVSTISASPIIGSIVTGSSLAENFGADGGHVQSITVNGITYRFDSAANTITPSGAATLGTNTYSFDSNTHQLTVTINSTEEKISMDMDNGAYTFTPPQTITSAINRSIDFVVVDNDGDTNGATLTFNIDLPGESPHLVVRDDFIVTNQTAIPVSVVLANDTGGVGASSITVNGITYSNTETINTTTSFDYINNSSTTGYASNTAHVDINRITGTTLSSTFKNEILLGGASTTDTVTYASTTNNLGTTGVTVSLATTGAQNTVLSGIDTLISIENLIGSNYNDILAGNSSNNTINGGNGNDTITYIDASGGVTVNLNAGTATGADGNDTLISIENITGSKYNDTLIGNASDNIINGGAGNDSINGGSGTDTVTYIDAVSTNGTTGVTVSLAISGAQNTVLSGNDTLSNIENLTGSKYNDTLTGNSSANIINGGAGNDIIDGGSGNDTVTYIDASGGVTVSLNTGTATGADGNDTLISIENITGSNYDDILAGNSSNNIIDGGNGNDTITYINASGAVTVNLSTGAATGADGSDTLSNIENIIGSNYNDTLTGNASDNIINGGAGNDSINGGAGNDTLSGGLGNDTINGGNGTDTVTYIDAVGGVTVSLATISQQNTVSSGLDTLSNIENLTGSNYNDTLTGNTSANMIIGGQGNDTLTGGAGADTFVWNSGDNIGNPTDTITDFNISQDKIDITNLLVGNVTAANLSNYLSVNVVGSNTQLTIDVDGAGSGTATQTINLTNVNANLTSLLNSGALIYSSNPVAAPIVFDLNNDGFNFTSHTNNSFLFDFNNNGTLQMAASIGSSDAFLVYDKNNDQTVNNGSEIVFADPTNNAFTDLQGLKVNYDTNFDNKLDSNDANFSQFGLWQDSNQNGVSDPGEFKSLSDYGITSIDLTGYREGFTAANGEVQVYSLGSFTYQDGSTGTFADAGFSLFESSAQDTTSSTEKTLLGEQLTNHSLLSEYTHLLEDPTEMVHLGKLSEIVGMHEFKLGGHSIELTINEIKQLFAAAMEQHDGNPSNHSRNILDLDYKAVHALTENSELNLQLVEQGNNVNVLKINAAATDTINLENATDITKHIPQGQIGAGDHMFQIHSSDASQSAYVHIVGTPIVNMEAPHPEPHPVTHV
ncbi:structural toxin protein RtxA [Legionella santicrucis]|uniref:Structural toxin protein RtxA n=1 Tax=Legionella santicrucis TaxID=45074 RepID=A0A0W0YIG2_9GAMM|nr:type I secretion C-terminal target domain-containing protein [Legionella santicrucis]KTD56730.1 structural toxin protein RtxA [Legionella santicrucis]